MWCKLETKKAFKSPGEEINFLQHKYGSSFGNQSMRVEYHVEGKVSWYFCHFSNDSLSVLQVLLNYTLHSELQNKDTVYTHNASTTNQS